MKDIKDMTLRELVEQVADCLRINTTVTGLVVLKEIKRRLDEIEAAVDGMAFLDAAVGEIKTGSFEGPWSGLQQHLMTYRAARDTRRGDASND